MSDGNQFSWLNYVVEANQDEEEPMGDEFFNNSESLTNVSSLVRESVQNSIDARKDLTRPVNMRFHVGRMSDSLNEKYLSNLMGHIDIALGNPLSKMQVSDGRFLIVEDFNTKGLKGRTTSKRPTKDLAEPDKDSYWFFEWKTGESNKDTNSGGKWGVGKVVFSFVSFVKTYLVFSSRDQESSPDGNPNIFFGHNIMKTHDLENDQRCKPKHRLMEVKGSDWVPYSDSEVISDFARDWNLKRNLDECGTSIVVPYCFSEFDAKSLTQSLAQDYFIAFLDGTLECEISDSFGNATVYLNKETLLGNIQELQDNLQTEATKTKEELIQLCLLYLSKLDTSVHRVEINLNQQNPNTWKHQSLEDQIKSDVVDTLNSLRPVIFDIKVKLPVRKIPKTYEEATFQVYLQKRDATRTRTTFCRQGILIPDAGKGLSVPTDYVSLVYAPVGAVSDFLSAAEDPSHKSWSSKQRNFVDFYKPETFSRDSLTFIRQATNQLIQATLDTGDNRDQTSLSKYFPMPNSGSILTATNTHPKVLLTKIVDKQDSKKVEFRWKVINFSFSSAELIRVLPTELQVTLPLDVNSHIEVLDSVSVTNQYYVRLANDTQTITSNRVSIAPLTPHGLKVSISGEDGNFYMKSLDTKSYGIGDTFELSVAYDLRDGKPFDSWKSSDFLLKDRLIKKSLTGLDVVFLDNKATFTVVKETFSANFQGFDVNRDLVFSVNTVN